MASLSATGQMGNTYVIYAPTTATCSTVIGRDGKGAPYEEAIGVPPIVRGPGVPQGTVRTQLVANTDWAPTMAA